MFTGKSDLKRYQIKIYLTKKELTDIQYCLDNFLKQIKLSDNSHYGTDKKRTLEEIIRINS